MAGRHRAFLGPLHAAGPAQLDHLRAPRHLHRRRHARALLRGPLHHRGVALLVPPPLPRAPQHAPPGRRLLRHSARRRAPQPSLHGHGGDPDGGDGEPRRVVHPAVPGGDRPHRHLHVQLEAHARGPLAHPRHRRVHVPPGVLHEDPHGAGAHRPRRRGVQGRRDALEHPHGAVVRDGGEGDLALRGQDQHLVPHHQAPRVDRRWPVVHHEPRG
mmetsp:Transcript_4327/g.10407  ORF Transcript_4327/g.10407 Transcript_4327/m.10407 type:complete len:214 (-) Transcript_4327:1451-2092(-)